jgi:hypothetical protein
LKKVKQSLESFDETSGVKEIFYRIDDKPFEIYKEPFEILTDGIHELVFYSVDNAGNKAPEVKVLIKIDTNAPETKSYLPRPVTYWQGIPVYNHPVEVTLKANDKTSGVKSTFYRDRSGKIDMPWKLYEGTFFVTGNGLHTVEFYSIDNAGNIEKTKSVSFIVYIQSHIDQIRDK